MHFKWFRGCLLSTAIVSNTPPRSLSLRPLSSLNWFKIACLQAICFLNYGADPNFISRQEPPFRT